MRAKQESCCFTGHRPDKLPWRYDEQDPRCAALKRRIADAVESAYAEGFRHFLCGMALGSDLYFCESVLALREKHPEITLEAAGDHGFRRVYPLLYAPAKPVYGGPRVPGHCGF